VPVWLLFLAPVPAWNIWNLMELEHQINTDPNTGGILVAHRLKKFFGCCHGRNAGMQKKYISVKI